MQTSRAPRRSLRAQLALWFLTLSVAPLAFIGYYSINQFQSALQREIEERLQSISRDVQNGTDELKVRLQKQKAQILGPAFFDAFRKPEGARMTEVLQAALLNEDVSELRLYGRQGALAQRLVKNGNLQVQAHMQSGKLLSEYTQYLKNNPELFFVRPSGLPQALEFVHLFRVLGGRRQLLGYVEQVFDMTGSFFKNIKRQAKAEVAIALSGQMPSVVTDRGLLQLSANPGRKFELALNNDYLLLISRTENWGESEIRYVVGTSQGQSRDVLKNINMAFYILLGTTTIILLSVIWILTRSIVRPLDDLITATRTVVYSDKPLQIPVRAHDEMGILTDSFNLMSENIIRARNDLKQKIVELERANIEIRETQAKLVHSSKMVSLGQLVAGVAHELNNPISFIYSNTGHLKDYFQKLMDLVSAAEQNSAAFESMKKKIDLDYIRTDLPKLVASCEEGARRTRDIVIGLRNFSRLEQATRKPTDLRECIESTLALLQGELKNRIEVHKKFADIPLVSVAASEINQVLMNLISNAAQAIKKSGDIWISTSVIQIKDRPYAQISVQDSGSGISNENLTKIFDPFFSTKGVGQGTGLGLSITDQIIRSHGGEIAVRSELGRGTEFQIHLPLE